MDINELDKSLEARIMLLDSNNIIDTSYAKKALQSHDIKDLVTAIIEARKINGADGEIWVEKLEEYYNGLYKSDLKELISVATNNYDYLIRKALESNKVENMYTALVVLSKDDNPIHSYWFRRIDDNFEKKVGFKYEERPDVFQETENQVNSAKNSGNLAKTLETIELLKELIDFNELPNLTPLYEKWNVELNDILKINTEATYEEFKEEFETKAEYILSVLNTLMLKKEQEKADQKVDYKDLELDTTGCETLDDIYVKYSKEIDDEYKDILSKKTILMQSVDSQMDVSNLTESELKDAQNLRKAKYMFNLDRMEYNTEDDLNEDEYREILKKSEEVFNLFKERNDFDFKDSKQVFYWLQKIVPYINIQSVCPAIYWKNMTSELGNIENKAISVDKPVDKALIELLKEAGYTSDKVVVNDIETFYKNMLAKEIKELEDYRFFVSEYDNNENERLTSDKIKGIANLDYHKEVYYEAERRLGHINNKLNSIGELRDEASIEWANKKKDLEERLEKVNKKIETINDLTVTSKIFRTEDTEAKEAYEKALSSPTKTTLTNMFSAIARLHDRDYKDKMLIVGYSLLDKVKEEETITKKDFQSIENANKLTYVNRRDMNDILEDKKDLEEDIDDIGGKLEEAFKEIEETEKLLTEEKTKYEGVVSNSKQVIAEVALDLSKKGYVDNTEEFKSIDIKVEEDKESLVDKFRNLFSRNKQDKEIRIITAEEETLNDFVPVRKIKPIKKTLYAKVNQQEFKARVSKGNKEMLLDIKRHPVAYTILALSVAIEVGVAAKLINEEINKQEDKKEITLEEAEITDIEIPYVDNSDEIPEIDLEEITIGK